MTHAPDPLLPDQNDRIMAALAHVAVILPYVGVIAPIVIWATQKDRSEFVAFQALQAVAYQLLMILAWFVGMGCYMLSGFVIFFAVPFSAIASEGDPNALPLALLSFVFPFLVFGVIFLGGAFFLIYGIVAAVAAFQGKDFRYALIGRRLANFMQQSK